MNNLNLIAWLAAKIIIKIILERKKCAKLLFANFFLSKII